MNFGKHQADRIGISEIEVNLNLEVSRLQNEKMKLLDENFKLKKQLQDCLLWKERKIKENV